MKVKDKMSDIKKFIITMIVIILGICAISVPYVLSARVESAALGEIFKDDLGILNSKEHPTHLFADYGIYLFCGAHKWDVDGFMTATEAHYTAWKNKAPIGKAEYDENNPYYLYARSETVGLYHSYRAAFNPWKSSFKPCCGSVSVSPAYQDDQSMLHSLRGSLPGIGKPVVKSIEYKQVGQYDTKTYIDAAFILTQQKVYDNAKAMPKDKEQINPDEKEKGYFNVEEKQYALWETGINVGAGNDGDDRNLGDIAKKFKEFYKIIKSSGYGSIINAIGEGIEQTSVGMGEDKAYKFKEAKVEIDASSNKYIYGPFCLDYAVDDATGDIYKSTPTNQVKFNAIEEIRIYDKNKNDITDASNFQIVYAYNGGNAEGQKLRRISDEKWYAKANYEEVKAFESSKPFYVVVDASNLNPDQLKGIYVETGFQYLDEVTATMYEYEGNVLKYFYKEKAMASQTVRHTASYNESNGTTSTTGQHTHSTKTSSRNFTVKTSGFELNREYSGEKAQKMVGYACDGTRTYKTYKVVLTTDWDDTGDTKIELEKICDNTNKPLAGAEYEITLDISGTDAHRNSINKTMKFYRTTDAKGKISITSSEIAIEGVYLGTFTGTINAKFHETKAPAGHEISNAGHREMKIKLSKGKIESVEGQGEKVSDTLARTKAENAHVNNPVIQIAKVNQDGKKIEEASFKIHVIYKVGNNAEVDNSENILGGTTEKGYLRLTRDDFKKLKKGFDFGTNFTGYITLQISEIGAPNNFSLSSNNLSVTLHYEKGKLVKREASENPSVVVDYAYKNWTENIQNWINAERKGEKFTMYSYVEENVKAWIKKQQEEHPELEYADILNYLEQYVKEIDAKIKDDKMPNPVLEDWDIATKVQGNNNVVQIVFKDTPGNFELPDIEITLDNMDLGGKVFLDYTEAKDGAGRNGQYDEGETLLYGIEVELLEYPNNKFVARTITNRNGEYLFKGLNPLKKYTVTFKYNGIQFEAKRADNVGEYNSAQWAISSKGAEISSPRDSFKTINKSNPAFTYEELEGLYEEIANYRWSVINSGGECPDLDTAISEIKKWHKGDEDKDLLDKKTEYIKKAVATSSAGQYPVYDKFILDFEGANAGSTTVEFAGDTVPYIYPGQLQIHQALVRRNKTDLELKTNIVETTVSMNRYDTTYNYNDPNNGSYHQYIYKEDYNYDTTSLDKDGKQREDGIAYYTEDNVHFYVTYESTIKNFTDSNTRLTQIIDYYNKEFNWKATPYITTKGIPINSLEFEYNKKIYDTFISYENKKLTLASKDGSRIILDISNNVNKNEKGKNYSNIIIGMGSENSLNSPSDEIKIRIRYELVGDTGENGNAKDVLAKYLFRNNEYGVGEDVEGIGKNISYAMEINHYTEITEYKTDSCYIDRDSHPGNFDVEAYEEAIKRYQEAREEYKENPSEENRLVAQTRKEDLTKMREDDTGTVSLTLTNSGTERTLTGNVWEAVGTANNGKEVKSSLDLQKGYGEDKYMLYNNIPTNQNLERITVELVELLNPADAEKKNQDGTGGEKQIVRAVTKTDEYGKYEFKSFIAGDYAVRFVYGEENNLHYSQVSTGKEGNIDGLPINGQYYQSTKANPNTAEHKPDPDEGQYWYYNNDKGDREDIKAKETDNKRYSDAYDDAYTRLAQMQTVVVPGNGIDQSTSTVYNFDGNAEVESTRVTDPIYAYTSTMNIEIEYVRPKVTGNKDNSWYKYDISNVDFGVTPRAANDVNVSRHISNVKLYVEGSNEPLIDAYYTESGRRIDSDYIEKLGDKATDTEKELAKKLKGEDFIMDSIMDGNKYIGVNLDYLLKITYESLLAQRAHLELTYAVKVTNDSDKGVTQDGKTVYDTIKYIYALDKNSNSTDRIIGVVYYDENVDKLTSYETVQYYEGDQIKEKGQIMYHNKIALGEGDTLPKENPSNINSNTAVNVRGEDRLQDINSGEGARPSRLINYARLDYSEGKANPIQSKVETIIDYPTAPLDFNGTDKLGNTINADWEETEPSEFVSSRENYKIENNVVSLLGKVGEEDSLMTQSHILKASKDSVLHDRLLPGESRETTLTLQHTLATTTEDISGDSTQDITGNDIEYSNLVEITRLQNDAGKVVDIEGYDVNGRIAGETSQIVRRSDLIHEEMEGVDVDTIKYGNGEQQYSDGKSRTEFGTQKIHLTPTLSTGKSPTTVINTPAGLSNRDNIFTYTGIAIAVLSLLAGGIVLIKKYVIVKIPKA